MAVLSVSAPVPAVVGIQISFGKELRLPIFGVGFSHSKSQRGISLFTVKQTALPPSIALPPPMAIMASCLPILKISQPFSISSSLGLGEIL